MSEMVPAYLSLDRLTHLVTQLELCSRFYFILRQWSKLWDESCGRTLVLYTHIGPSHYLTQGYLSYVPILLFSPVRQWSECDWCWVKAWREGCVGHSWILSSARSITVLVEGLFIYCHPFRDILVQCTCLREYVAFNSQHDGRLRASLQPVHHKLGQEESRRALSLAHHAFLQLRQ